MIQFRLTEADRVSLRIYDHAGRLVRTLFSGNRAADTYQVPWDGRDNQGRKVGPGVYRLVWDP